MDKLYDCSTIYERLRKNYTFELELDSAQTGQKKITLSFPQKRFCHCIGVEKLVDLDEIYTAKDGDNIHAKQFYQKVRKQIITENDLKQSVYFSEPISQKNGIEYFIEDRINNLANLYDYFHNSIGYSQNHADVNIHIYTWELNTDPSNRPENSSVSADLMVCFTDVLNKKTDEEKSYVWFQDTGRIDKNSNHIYEITTGYIQNDTLKSKQKEVEEYKKEHTVSPQQHNKNRGR